MKLTNIKRNLQSVDIIELPNNFLTLLSINNIEKYFEYKVSFVFDPIKASTNKSFVVEFQVSTTPIDPKLNVNSITNNNNDLIRNILTRTQSLRDLYRSQESKIIKKFRIDLTSVIPNDLTRQLSYRNINEDFVIKKQVTIKPVSIQELNEKNISMPFLDMNLNNKNSVQDNRIDNLLARLDSSRLIFNKKIDPATFVGKKTETFFSAKKTRQGTSVSKEFKQFNDKNDFYQETRLIRSLISTNQAYDQSDLPQNSTINVPTVENTTKLVVEKIFKIPFSDQIEPDFYLNLRLKNRKELYVQNISRLINHSRNVEKLSIPVEPPNIRLLKHSYNGEVVLELKQKDSNATKIKVYRKDIKKTQPVINSEYVFVGEVNSLSTDAYPTTISDPHISTNPSIYRAIAVNNNGIVGAEFNSIVVESPKITTTRKEKRWQSSYFVSMNYLMNDTGIIVFIKDIPPEVIAVELLRRNKTNYQTKFERVGDITLIKEITPSSLSFNDSPLSKYKIYEYKLKLHFKNGISQFASNQLLIEYDPVTNNIIDLTVDAPQKIEVGNEIDVTFNITKNILQTDSNKIKTFLELQGFSTEFQEDVTINKEKLGNIFAVGVIRFNLTTSEMEDYGIIDSDQFSDIKYGQPRGVKSLQPGCEYRYVLTAYAREPETLFSTLERTIETQTNSYSLKPKKWRHPVTLTDGNIVSDTSLLRNHSYSTFTFGNVVDTVEINVSLNDILPSIYDSKSVQISSDKVLIEWKVQGNILKIDHFIIVMETSGIKTIVGKCHNISNSNYFQFVDWLSNGETGELTYNIVPVYYDYSRGSETKTNQIII